MLFEVWKWYSKSIFLDLAFLLTVNWNPLSGEYLMYPLGDALLWSIITLESLQRKCVMQSREVALIGDLEGEI